MALSGSISKTYTTNSAFTAILSWSASQNIPQNNSTVTASLKIKSNYSWATAPNWNGITATISVNGSSSSGSINTAVGGGGTTGVLLSKVAVVSHNSDGTKRFPFSFSINFSDVNWNGSKIGVISSSGSGTLNVIHRASTFTLNKTEVVLGESISVTINRKNSSFQHVVKSSFAGDTKTVSNKTSSTSLSWTVPLGWAGRIPSGTSSAIAFYVDTYSGNSLIGSHSVMITAKVPDGLKPSISTIGATEMSSDVSPIGLPSGYFLQGKSIIRAFISVNIAQASPIVSYNITLRSGNTIVKTWTHNGHVFDIYLEYSAFLYGAPNIDYEAVDARGRSAKSTIAVNVIQYSKPKITTLDARRVGDGTSVEVTKKISATRIDSTRTNYEVKIWARPVGQTGSYELKSHEGNVNTEKVTIGGFLVDKSYEIVLQVVDYFGENQRAQSSITLSTLAVLLDMYKDTGLGIGKMYEDTGSIMDVEGRINTNRNGLYKSGFHYEELPAGDAYSPAYWRSFLVYGHSWFFYNASKGNVRNMLNSHQVISCWTDGATIFIQTQSITDGRLAFMRILNDTVTQQWKSPY